MDTEIRRIYSSGGSFIITLPKKWVKMNNLKAGDTVVIQIGDRSISISPQMAKIKREVKIDAKSLKKDELVRRIISYYLIGLDKLIVRIYNDEHRKAINIASDILIGAEIIEDMGREVCMEVFLGEKYDIEDILKRISNTSITMFSDLCLAMKNFNEYLCNSIIIREYETDRLHLLALRLLNLTPSSCQELFGYWSFARRFERIADHIANCSKCLLKLKKDIPYFYEITDPILDMLKKSNESFFQRNIELAEVILKEFEEIRKKEDKLYKWIIKQKIEEALLLKSILDSLMRISAYSTDIAEISMNRSCYLI